MDLGKDKNIRKIGNIRLVHGATHKELGSIFSEAAHLMSEIVHGNLIHFKYDELYLLVSRDEEQDLEYIVGIPIIGNIQNKNLITKDLNSGDIESVEIGLEKLREYKKISELFNDLGIDEDYFLRISSHEGDYQVFYEKYLLH
ncbi:hypothetical protein [Halobacteriovorax sp.]|uniref:hypothetical protein n=1 Tax=Halobacteriovorax sp. TaxID=2020862 RepID=UPI003AF2D654